MSAEIAGIGWVTAASMGCGRDHKCFSMPYGQLPEITDTDVFDEPYLYLRRMDQYSRMGMAAIAFALKDADLAQWTQKRNIGIIASTLYGCLGTDVDYYDTVMAQKGLGASPSLFAYTLHSSFLGEASIRFGLTGTSFIITEQHPLGRVSIQMALEHITSGEQQKILCGICDLGCPPPFGDDGNQPHGALFFLIEKLPARKSLSYGNLGLNKAGDVIFNGSEIEDLAELVRKCIANRSDKGGRNAL